MVYESSLEGAHINFSLLKRAFIAIIEAAKIYMSNSVFTTVNPQTNKEITIRRERSEEYFTVENLVREAFWNVYRPGCLEHYV